MVTVSDDVTDFVFKCHIKYRRVTSDDGARFDVVLTFDGEVDVTTAKTTTSLERTVVFNSTDLRGHFGTDVGKIFNFKQPLYHNNHHRCY